MVNKENKYPSRKCFDFKVKYCKSKIKSNCISILGVKLWNMLDDKLKILNTALSFKKGWSQITLKNTRSIWKLGHT